MIGPSANFPLSPPSSRPDKRSSGHDLPFRVRSQATDQRPTGNFEPRAPSRKSFKRGPRCSRLNVVSTWLSRVQSGSTPKTNQLHRGTRGRAPFEYSKPSARPSGATIARFFFPVSSCRPCITANNATIRRENVEASMSAPNDRGPVLILPAASGWRAIDVDRRRRELADAGSPRRTPECPNPLQYPKVAKPMVPSLCLQPASCRPTYFFAPRGETRRSRLKPNPAASALRDGICCAPSSI